MSPGPSSTQYGRWLGWQVSALRRLLVTTVVGLAAGLGLAPFVSWPFAVLVGWDVAAIMLVSTLAPLLWADGARTKELAVREDLNREVARLFLLAASSASLVAVGFALGLAHRHDGATRALLVTLAAVTVVVSWTLVNGLFTLRYAHLYYRGPVGGVDFEGDGQPPDYRDFAYLAFTIGMTYQVSDTTLRDRRFRGTVLVQALLSYVFGVVIVSAGVNTIAGLLS
jgi:uncharacterized membrane protein